MILLILFTIGMLIIYLGTIKTPKWFIKICGEMHRGKLIVKNHFRAFSEYIGVLWEYCIFCHKQAKLSRIRKRAEKQIKNGDIYSKKQV